MNNHEFHKSVRVVESHLREAKHRADCELTDSNAENREWNRKNKINFIDAAKHHLEYMLRELDNDK